MQMFVAHDFRNPPIKNYRRPFQVVAEKHKCEFKFADDIHAADHLLDQIEELIATCDYSLFDVSTWNRNVFLELGFARGRKRPHALLFRPMSGVLWQLGFREGYEDVPSDLKGVRLLQYKNEWKLRLHLDELIRELLPKTDLSRSQDILMTRIEGLIERDSAGLTVRQIADLLNLDIGLASAAVRNLLNSARIKASGYGPHTRYNKVAGPDKAA